MQLVYTTSVHLTSQKSGLALAPGHQQHVSAGWDAADSWTAPCVMGSTLRGQSMSQHPYSHPHCNLGLCLVSSRGFWVMFITSRVASYRGLTHSSTVSASLYGSPPCAFKHGCGVAGATCLCAAGCRVEGPGHQVAFSSGRSLQVLLLDNEHSPTGTVIPDHPERSVHVL